MIATRDLKSLAVEYLGLTENLVNAGFIFPDGQMLDFARGRDMRLFSHYRAVEEATGQKNSLYKFMHETQALRVIHSWGTHGDHFGFQSMGPLTPDQLGPIREHIGLGKIADATCEKVDEAGKTVGATRTIFHPSINDIVRFFNGSEI